MPFIPISSRPIESFTGAHLKDFEKDWLGQVETRISSSTPIESRTFELAVDHVVTHATRENPYSIEELIVDQSKRTPGGFEPILAIVNYTQNRVQKAYKLLDLTLAPNYDPSLTPLDTARQDDLVQILGVALSSGIIKSHVDNKTTRLKVKPNAFMDNKFFEGLASALKGRKSIKDAYQESNWLIIEPNI